MNQKHVSHSHQATYRILDASANRAAEGFRSIEEYFRFALDDQKFCETLKELRHELAAALSVLPRVELLRARDTEFDVGTKIETESEYARVSSIDVVIAATQRVQQSLRVLEEYGKTTDPAFARRIESLRYRAYTLFRDVELKLLCSSVSSDSVKSQLQSATLYVLIECMKDVDEFITSIKALSQAGVNVFQLRDKSATDRVLFERAVIGTKTAEEHGALFIVNDRVDLAIASQASGVHLGQDELPLIEARKQLGNDRLIGVSTHTMEQVHTAIAGGADYIGCGPTFDSQTKSFQQFPGTTFLKAVHQGTKETPRPAFAIGGISAENVHEVVACGFHRIAVTAAIMKASDRVAAAAKLKKLIA